MVDLRSRVGLAVGHDSIESEDRAALRGCVYIDPPEKRGADAEISWWVVDDEVGGALERALDAFVPTWISADWPFERPRFIGRDVTWDDWLTSPPRERGGFSRLAS